jgi:repressor LexA
MPRKKKLSSEQVLKAVHRLLTERGHPPTVEELRSELGLGSTRTAFRYLQDLESEGHIERWSGARGIKIARRLSAGHEMVQVPILGEAPAGPLMVAEENRDGWVSLSKSAVRPAGAPVFLLRVRGDSMNRATVRGKTIENGDLVLVRQQAHADDSDIIVALIDGQATIKQFKAGSDYVVLSPNSSNRTHQQFIVTDDFEVQGIVIDVLKRGQELITDNN